MPNFDTQEVVRNLNKFEGNVKSAAKVALRLTGAQTVNYAKSNAPWTDRTGNARQSIHEEFNEDSGTYSSSVGIGAEYGVYLELSNGGRFRIVDPAVFTYGRNQLLENLRGIM